MESTPLFFPYKLLLVRQQTSVKYLFAKRSKYKWNHTKSNTCNQSIHRTFSEQFD